MSLIIGIDGPAGSGKGTLTKIIAEKLNLVNINTGALYRCIALQTLRENVSPEDEEKVASIAKKINISFDSEDHVYLEGEDVTTKIYEKDVAAIVSIISKIVPVREEVVNQTRKIAEGKDVILEGRDVTTVIFPNANYKFYLDASVESRAKRRVKQNEENNIKMSYEEVLESIKTRDYNDTHKDVGALKRTEDQIYIDSTNLSINEVAELMLSKIKER